MEERETTEQQRHSLLARIEKVLEIPISVLGFVWLVLLIVEMVHGLSPLLKGISISIWGIFVLDFILRFIIAPNKLDYVKREWLVALSLLIPAIRLFRVFSLLRILSVVQGGSIIAMIGSINRSMRSFQATLKRRGFIYILAITIAVLLLGSAGMYTFEKKQPGGFQSYADALWWTCMLLISIGSEYWPKTPAGKMLSLIISIYGFSVFGYITATLASLFIGRDAERADGPVAGSNDIAALRKDIQDLQRTIEELRDAKKSEQST